MKLFVKKHRHHFGLWFISAAILTASIFWLNSLDNRLEGLSSTVQNVSPAVAASGQAPALTALTAAKNKEKKLSDKKDGFPEQDDKTNPQSTVVFSQESTSAGKDKEEKIEVDFKIIGQDWIKEFHIAVPANGTVYEVMLELRRESGLAFEAKEFGGLGAFVQSIDGVENDGKNNKFWIYYINGKPAPLGISSQKLNSGDAVIWKYEEGKF